MITSIIFFILELLGIVGIFTGNFTFIVIGAVADIIDNLLGIFLNGQNNIGTMLVALLIGLIVGSNIGDIPKAMLSALCIEGAIMSLLSIPAGILLLKNKKTEKPKEWNEFLNDNFNLRPNGTKTTFHKESTDDKTAQD